MRGRSRGQVYGSKLAKREAPRTCGASILGFWRLSRHESDMASTSASSIAGNR